MLFYFTNFIYQIKNSNNILESHPSRLYFAIPKTVLITLTIEETTGALSGGSFPVLRCCLNYFFVCFRFEI